MILQVCGVPPLSSLPGQGGPGGWAGLGWAGPKSSRFSARAENRLFRAENRESGIPSVIPDSAGTGNRGPDWRRAGDFLVCLSASASGHAAHNAHPVGPSSPIFGTPDTPIPDPDCRYSPMLPASIPDSAQLAAGHSGCGGCLGSQSARPEAEPRTTNHEQRNAGAVRRVGAPHMHMKHRILVRTHLCTRVWGKGGSDRGSAGRIRGWQSASCPSSNGLSKTKSPPQAEQGHHVLWWFGIS